MIGDEADLTVNVLSNEILVNSNCVHACSSRMHIESARKKDL